jgi:hypothetical protein
MRLLLHSQDAGYDTTTKKYAFTLDRRVDKPTTLRVVKAHYSATTMAEYPLVVYLRSDALHRLIGAKHTLRLKNNNHEATENILCTLAETDRGTRYSATAEGRRFKTDPHIPMTTIDVYFTDNATILPGIYSAPLVPGVSETQLEALFGNGIHYFVDMDKPGAFLDGAGQEQTVAGDPIGSIDCRYPADGTYRFTTAYNMTWELINAYVKGATGDGSWAYTQDATNAPADVFAAGSYVFLIKTPANVVNYEVGWVSQGLQLVFLGNSLCMHSNQANSVLVGVLQSTDYLIRIDVVRSTNGDGTQNGTYDTTLEKLSDNSTITNQLVLTNMAANNQIFNASLTQHKISTAQTHLDTRYGSFAHCSTANAPTLMSYLRQKYNNEATVPVVDPDAVDASWFLELDIETK